MIDGTLKVYQVKYGDNVIGIMQSLDAEAPRPMELRTIGTKAPIFIPVGSPITIMRLLMSREQKYMFAVTYRLMGKLVLSMDTFGQGIYKITGNLDIPTNLLRAFIEKKHAEDEVEFQILNASIEVHKEKKREKVHSQSYESSY